MGGLPFSDKSRRRASRTTYGNHFSGITFVDYFCGLPSGSLSNGLQGEPSETNMRSNFRERSLKHSIGIRLTTLCNESAKYVSTATVESIKPRLPMNLLMFCSPLPHRKLCPRIEGCSLAQIHQSLNSFRTSWAINLMPSPMGGYSERTDDLSM